MTEIRAETERFGPRGDAESIEIRLNGEPRSLVDGGSVADLVTELGKDPRTLAIEHNGTILPRARWAETPIAAGDRLEVVHFVQGG